MSNSADMSDDSKKEFMSRVMSNLDGEKDAEIERLRAELAEYAGSNTNLRNDIVQMGMARDSAERALREAREAIQWVETWVSNPVGSYSVHALDGLFGMTRDKIAALRAFVNQDDRSEHEPGCLSGDFGPCDCSLSSNKRGSE